MKALQKLAIILSNVCCYIAHSKHARSRGIFTTLCCNYSSRMDRTGRNVDPGTDTLRGAAKVVKQRQSININSSTSSITREKRSQNCNDASSRHVKEDCKPRTIKAMKPKTMGEPRRHGMPNRVLTNSGKIVVIDTRGMKTKGV